MKLLFDESVPRPLAAHFPRSFERRVVGDELFGRAAFEDLTRHRAQIQRGPPLALRPLYTDIDLQHLRGAERLAIRVLAGRRDVNLVPGTDDIFPAREAAVGVGSGIVETDVMMTVYPDEEVEILSVLRPRSWQSGRPCTSRQRHRYRQAAAQERPRGASNGKRHGGADDDTSGLGRRGSAPRAELWSRLPSLHQRRRVDGRRTSRRERGRALPP